uniref:ABC transporter ATP-binding protein n=1 Tax=Peptostreptococcus faecalis TaxID=2045015 RepID=UPI002E8E33A4|nr:ABC transporter transmembrane domain-containing protein [Peptostreptococcus faecalis]
MEKNKTKKSSGTWGKMIAYSKKYIAIVIVAIICAISGTVFTLVGPDKLSEMTDTVTEGVKPDIEKFKEISKEISTNFSDNMPALIEKINKNMSDKEAMSANMSKIMTSESISAEEKKSLQDAIKEMSASSNSKEASEKLMSLPDGVLDILFSKIEVNGVELSGKEQVQVLKSLEKMDKKDEKSMIKSINKLPEAAKETLYKDFKIDGVLISSKDQMKMMDIFSNLNMKDTEDTMAAMDKLPKSIYGLVKSSVDMDKVFGIGFLLIILYALSYILSTLQGWIMATITQKISKALRYDISKKINKLPMSFYDRTTTGDVLSRVTNDVDTISQSLNQSIGNLVSSAVLFLGSLFMMLKTSGTMTLTAIVSVLIGFVMMFAIMRRSQKYFTRQQKHLGEINGHIEEIYTGHNVVKAYNGEADAEKTFSTLNEKLRDSAFKSQCLSGLMMPIMMFIGNFGYVAVCVVGGMLALNDKISFGVIVAFMMYVRYFTQPLSQIAQAMQALQSAGAAGGRVFEFLEAKEMEDESDKVTSLPESGGSVEFEHVEFGYEGTDKNVINDFSVKVESGQKIAIVGPTGAGKTTIVNLLMRFHEIKNGDIKIDGISTRDLTREAVHSQFCMVLQDTWLFEGTVRENLVYCEEGIPDEKIKSACKAVGLDHFIRTLPKGYDTVLNEQVSLSQGEKQQLTIARAMISDKPMLILDEATSSVDTRTELLIQNAMDELMKNRTSFVIAHRLSTIKNADVILVMNEGDIIEKGNHEELLESGGFYADLYNSQFEQAL